MLVPALVSRALIVIAMILLHLQNGTRRELILLGDQDGNALQAKLSGTPA